MAGGGDRQERTRRIAGGRNVRTKSEVGSRKAERIASNEFKYLNYKSCARGLIHGGAALEERSGLARGPTWTSAAARRGPGSTGVGNRPVRSEKKAGARKENQCGDSDGGIEERGRGYT